MPTSRSCTGPSSTARRTRKSAGRGPSRSAPYGTASPDAGQLAAGAAAWSLVHGLATLWLNGNLPEALGHDPEEITRIVAPHLDVGRR